MNLKRFEQLLEEMFPDDKDEVLCSIWLTLYPDGDLNHEWSSNELQSIAGIFSDAGLMPDEEDRCEHGMFYSGAGACPQCGGGAE